MLILLKDVPFDNPNIWPAAWVWAPGGGRAFEAIVFSRRFSKQGLHLPIRIHVSADQRYKLYLDGRLIGLGPVRGEVTKWFFDSYDLTEALADGEHVLTAVVWHDRNTPPTAQISHRPGFILVADGPDGSILNTGPNWRCRPWPLAKTLIVPEDAFNIGAGFEMSGFTTSDLAPELQELTDRFSPVCVLGWGQDYRSNGMAGIAPWQLTPRTIPALEAEIQELGRFREGGFNLPQTFPPHGRFRFLLDHGTLTAGYPIFQISGGAGSIIRLGYQEALQSDPTNVRSKGHRNEIEGRTAVGIEDVFHADGRNRVAFEPFWYRCWRYIQVEVQTAEEDLVLEGFHYRTTGYPLTLNAQFQTDRWFTRLIEPGFRTLRLCANETYMDCPYYEQLQYLGDTRIQIVATYLLSGDDRLARHAIDAFDRSRLPDGLTQARYPSRVVQVLPVFSLMYIGVLHDFLMWRGDLNFLRPRLKGVEAVLRAFEAYIRPDGLIGTVPKWAFTDWVSEQPGWINGQPPGAAAGESFLINFIYLYALQLAADLFHVLDEEPKAQTFTGQAEKIQSILREKAFGRNEKFFYDDYSKKYLSHHTNIMAILTDSCRDLVDPGELLDRVLDDPRCARTSLYFSFYLFEAMQVAGRGNLIWPALGPWHDMLDRGLTTFAEKADPTRSDCHAWSVHPLYHYFASILGIRPAAPGCRSIHIQPAPCGKLLPDVLGGTVMLPQGACAVRLEKAKDQWKVHVDLPPGVACV